MTRLEPIQGEWRSYKIRMYPSGDQKRELKKWFAAGRNAYNRAVDLVKNSSEPPNLVNLKKKIVNNDKVPNAWELDVPARVRARAVGQYIDAVKTNVRKNEARELRGEQPKAFNMHFRSLRKTPTETIVMESKKTRGLDGRVTPAAGPIHSFTDVVDTFGTPPKNQRGRFRCAGVRFAPSTSLGKMGSVQIRDKRWLIDRLLNDGALREDGLIWWQKKVDAFYLIVRFDTPLVADDPDPAFENKRVVALDPGVVGFQTFYSPDGTHGELLKGDLDNKIKKMAQRVDGLQSVIDRVRARSLYPNLRGAKRRQKLLRLRRKSAKLRYKLQCWRHNVHYESANFLLERYDVVLIPEFQTSRMAKKQARVINNDTVRSMYTWAHYEFRKRLETKSKRYPGRHVITIGEPGTSKTCGNCGAWNAWDQERYKRTRVGHCQQCGVVVERDVNGARNNLMATLG